MPAILQEFSNRGRRNRNHSILGAALGKALSSYTEIAEGNARAIEGKRDYKSSAFDGTSELKGNRALPLPNLAKPNLEVDFPKKDVLHFSACPHPNISLEDDGSSQVDVNQTSENLNVVNISEEVGADVTRQS
jgi:hypothetical protein